VVGWRMRLFVALSPPPGALAELEETVERLRAGWPQLRWPSPDKWHVTLAFLGEVDESKLAELGVRLERAAARHDSQRLLISGGGAFPSPAKARTLIARIESADGDLTRLVALARSVAAGARRAGAPPPDEGRRYRPHLTLARTKQPADLGGLVAALGGPHGTPWLAAEIELVESRLGPAPDYRTIGSWPLRMR
jgi:2'-5' RNA ligase